MLPECECSMTSLAGENWYQEVGLWMGFIGKENMEEFGALCC